MLANFSPGFALKPRGQKAHVCLVATLKELRRLWISARRRNPDFVGVASSIKETRFPRVAKAQPWAGISERLQRLMASLSILMASTSALMGRVHDSLRTTVDTLELLARQRRTILYTGVFSGWRCMIFFRRRPEQFSEDTLQSVGPHLIPLEVKV